MQIIDIQLSYAINNVADIYSEKNGSAYAYRRPVKRISMVASRDSHEDSTLCMDNSGFCHHNDYV